MLNIIVFLNKYNFVLEITNKKLIIIGISYTSGYQLFLYFKRKRFYIGNVYMYLFNPMQIKHRIKFEIGEK